MMLDDIINDDKITEKLQSALDQIEKSKVEIDSIFDSVYAIALSRFKNVTRTDDAITITFDSKIERDMCEEFYTRYLVHELENELSLDRKMLYLVYRIYSTADYLTIVRKRK